MDEAWSGAAEWVLRAAMGASLAACSGLRAFLPLLVVGVAGRLNWVSLAEPFAWLASGPTLTVLGIAVLCEVAADKVPIVDHALDGIATLVKPVAGALVMTMAVNDRSPLAIMVLSIILGGSLAGFVHVQKAKLRFASTALTGGVANPVLSTGEDLGALAGSVGAILVPLVLFALAVISCIALWLVLRRFRSRSAAPRPL